MVMAVQTSGTNSDIICFEILKVYMRLVYESPLARKRRVTASLLVAETGILKFVSFFEIHGPTISRRHSKSTGLIRTKFRNPISSSNLSVSRRLCPCLFRSLNKLRIHQRGGFLLDFFLLRRVMYSATAIPASATSFDMAQIQTRCVHDFQSDNVAGQ